MSTAKPSTPAEHIARAKEELARDGGAHYAIAHALVALAELTQTNIAETYIEGAKAGAGAAAEALGSLFGGKGIPQ